MPKGFYRREFLNREGYHSTGFVYAVVDDDETTLRIGDCSRQIDLDIGYWTRDEADNALEKLDLLIDVLKGTKKAMQARIRKKSREWEDS